jgi:hypothetical protein
MVNLPHPPENDIHVVTAVDHVIANVAIQINDDPEIDRLSAGQPVGAASPTKKSATVARKGRRGSTNFVTTDRDQTGTLAVCQIDAERARHLVE